MMTWLPFLGSLLITSALQPTSALCNCSLSIFTAMKCDYKSRWKVNKWNLEDRSGNRDSQNLIFGFVAHVLCTSEIRLIICARWCGCILSNLRSSTEEKNVIFGNVMFMQSFLRSAGCLTECLTYLSLFLSETIWEYHLFNTVGLDIFWYMNSKFSSGGASFHAVNGRLLPTGFLVSPFADCLTRPVRIIRNLCITGWKNIDLW